MFNVTTDNPCRDCKERQVGCHATCNKYIEWRKEYDRVTKGIRNRRHQKGIGYLGEHFKHLRKRGNLYCGPGRDII